MRLIYTLVFFAVFSTAVGQNYNYYRTGLLIDAYDNPYQTTFKNLKGKNVIFSILPIQQNFRFSGKFGTTAGNLAFGENIGNKFFTSSYDSKFSSILNQARIGTFIMRIKLSEKHNRELLIANVTEFDNRVLFSNNMLKFLTQFNGPFPDADVKDFLTMRGYATVFNRTTIGYRQTINDKLSVGINAHYITSLGYAGFNLSNTSLVLSPDSTSFQLAVKGSATVSFDPESKDLAGDLRNNVMKNQNSGLAATIGLQYDINNRFTTTLTIRDLGRVKFNSLSKTYTIDTVITYEGVNLIDTAWANDFADKIWSSAKSHVEQKSFTAPLRGGFDLGFKAQWFKIFSQSAIVSYQPYINNVQFTLVNQLKLSQTWYWAFNAGFGTSRNTMFGTALYLNSRPMNFYLGTEQIMGLMTKGVNLGLGVNFGLAFKM